MNFPFLVAKRYLFSKKSQHAINIISIISVVGVMVGTMGLIIVLSVFNGFEKLVFSLYNSFDSEIIILPKEGKTFDKNTISYTSFQKIKGIDQVSEVLEENALIKYNEKQYIATIKGVGDNYSMVSGVDSMVWEGNFILKKDSVNFAVIGRGISEALSINLDDVFNTLDIYMPRKGIQSMNPEEAFNNDLITPAGIFSVQQEFDEKYVIVPIRFIRKLMNNEKTVSALAIGLKSGADADDVKADIQKLIGNNFEVKTREQQHELLYKIMKSEKWAVYLILTFILIIATFNVIGSLTMLILDKKKDIFILESMGASASLRRKIFLAEGMMISITGALIGLFLGGVICFLQQHFGFVRMNGAFVVDVYPVDMQALNFVYVFLTVLTIGFVAAWYPAKKLVK